MYPHFKRRTSIELNKRLTIIERNRQILENKLRQIDHYAKGYYYPVSSLISGKNISFNSDSLNAFVFNEIIGHWRTISYYDKQENFEIHRLVGSFLFLALSICAFFEQNPDAAEELSYISVRNLAGVVLLSEADGFVEYLQCKEDSREETTKKNSYSFSSNGFALSDDELFRNATIEDLEWYEHAVTESYYDMPTNNKHNDFFNLMYIICSVLQDKAITPDYDTVLLPKNPKKVGPSSEELFFEPEFYELDREANPALFKKIEEETYLCSHKHLIDTFSRYANRFPCENDPNFKFCFLINYERFRNLYLKYGFKGNLHKWVTDCLDNYLSFGTDLSFLGAEETFEDFYEPLFNCASEISELYENKILKLTKN